MNGGVMVDSDEILFSDGSVSYRYTTVGELEDWIEQAVKAMEKAIETSDTTGLKEVVNNGRDLGLTYGEQ